MARRNRSGFTLVELMLALTLTAIAAAVAGSTMVAARRTGERVAAHQQQSAADVRLRGLLSEMLRHAPLGERVSEPLLQIRQTVNGPVLEFLTTGVQPPFGAGPVWRATLWEDSTGLQLRVVPLRDEASAQVLTLQLAEGAALTIEVLEPRRAGEMTAWRTDWPIAQMRPAAVRFTWQQDGATREPLVVALNPLAVAGSAP